MPKKYRLEIKEAPDNSGDYIIEFPPELLEEAGFKENDLLNIDLKDGKIIINKVEN